MQAMFEETVGRVLTHHVTAESLTAAERGQWSAELWAAIVEHGLAIAAAPEDRGGVGGSWHDAFVLIRAAGRYAAPLPLAETILVNWLLGLAGADVAPGAATLAISAGALDDDCFTGTLDAAAWGRQASHVLTAIGDGRTLVLLRCADARILPAFNTAREPRDSLVFTGARATTVATLPETMPTDTLLLGGAMIRSAQIAGGLSHLLDTAIDYANQRVQFGRPIGKFQAIQHQLAVLAEQTALASAAAELAFASSERTPSVPAIAAAKTIASDAAGQGAAIAHAVLGAIGFTYEHSLHFTTRRLWSWRSEFGSQTYWAQRLGREMCSQGAGGYWPKLTSAMAPA